MTKLTDKQTRFVQEYCPTRNATQAAINAGYAIKGARQAGSKLLALQYIQDAIALHEKPHLERLGLDEYFVLSNLKDIAITCADEETYNPNAAIKANVAIGTHLKMFTHMKETKISGEVNLKEMSDDELAAKLAMKLTKSRQRIQAK